MQSEKIPPPKISNHSNNHNNHGSNNNNKAIVTQIKTEKIDPSFLARVGEAMAGLQLSS